DEVSISTGGNDIRAQTGGIGINLVTRRGTNKFRGSAHYLLDSHKAESKNLPDELLSHTIALSGRSDTRLENPAGWGGPALACNGTFRDEGDHILQIGDFGGDLGGPIVKDKLWFYGSWGRQDIRIQRILGTLDRTKLTSYNAKINWQASSSDMVSAFY